MSFRSTKAGLNFILTERKGKEEERAREREKEGEKTKTGMGKGKKERKSARRNEEKS